MVSRVQRGVQHPLTVFILALAIWGLSGSPAMAQYGGGGGGGMGMSMGGYGYSPGLSSLSFGGSGSPAIYGGSGFPFYGDGTSYGYGLSYGYPMTQTNTGFLGPVLRPRKIRAVHRIGKK